MKRGILDIICEETKTERAIKLFKSGANTASYKIFKDFKIGFSESELRTLQIVYESNSDKSKGKFYQSIGINLDEMREQAAQIIKDKYAL